jgi:alpha-tubulin suppressor-like RCC1 family protein
MGDVYVFGSNDYGQLGIGSDKLICMLPKRVNLEKDSKENIRQDSTKVIKTDFVEQLHVGPLHMFAITSIEILKLKYKKLLFCSELLISSNIGEGVIYTWGLGSHGQLGNEKILVKVHFPRAINSNLKGDVEDYVEDYEKMFSLNSIKHSLDRIRVFLGFDCSFLLFG